MKKIPLFLRSRHFWTAVAVCVASLVIWSASPPLSFGEQRPLAAVGMRVTLIVLLVVAWILWMIDWSAAIVLVALACLTIWFAFPLVSVADKRLFASSLVRSGMIGGMLLAYALYVTYGLLRRLGRNPSHLRRFFSVAQNADRTATASHLRDIERIASRAVKQLKSARFVAPGLMRLFRGPAHLYELPWYVVLGSKGSGKTTALLNSGLTFPLDSAMPRSVASEHSRGLPVWRLTNEAVLIDTAGHYVRHGGSSYPLPAARNHGKSNNRPTRTQSDAAQWDGFLRLLRTLRPRMAINGALLTVDVAVLAHADAKVRVEEGRALRARLEEMRASLGVGFPVWLVVTKMDLVTGFTDYFEPLNVRDRARVWGFTLPYDAEGSARDPMLLRCKAELNLLATRLAEGVTQRLRDESGRACPSRIAALPDAFSALVRPLSELIEQVFGGCIDARMPPSPMLRGVYLTSARQTGRRVAAERQTVLSRMVAAAGARVRPPRRTDGNTRFFLGDLLSHVVFRESRLARTDPQWEHRARLQRWVGHSLVWLVAAGLTANLRHAFFDERTSLDALGGRAQALTAMLADSDLSASPERIPTVLDEANELLRAATHSEVGGSSSALTFGVSAIAEIEAVSQRTYGVLATRFVLPRFVSRMEEVIERALASGDVVTLYDALRVYLMLHDEARFDADDVKAWVLDDWAKHESADVWGGRAAMAGHMQRLFSGERAVSSMSMPNEALIGQARALLDRNSATDRLYQRAKAAMQSDAPEDFTLLRVIGPQAGTVFTRASGAPLSRGVPGLFTVEGYRAVFERRLAPFLRTASDDDAWVMGRRALGETQAGSAGMPNLSTSGDDALSTAIRRQYLMEYAQVWDEFLDDVRPVSGTSLAFQRQVLRHFAAPDSPLVRLARAAAHETTLTQPLSVADASFAGKAAEALNQQAEKMLGPRPSEHAERELVDNHFAALREVVTGSADAGGGRKAGAVQRGETGLDGVTALLNDYYEALAVSDHALSIQSLPPASDAAAILKMTADTMPAPLSLALRQFATDGSREVSHGIGRLLSRRMQVVVGDTCRVVIEGHYPFAPESARDVSLDDFARLFAHGGVIDGFVTTVLAPLVDTAAKPWRYRTLPGAVDPVQGPDLEPFQHAAAIRDVFFPDPDDKQPVWKADIRIPDLDPTITSLSLNIDDQTTLYRHGPVQPFVVIWPGARGGAYAEISVSPRIAPETATVVAGGPWALMRLLRKGRVIETATLGRTRVEFDFDGRKAALDIVSAASVANPLTSDVLSTFRCPTTMPMFSLPDSGPPPGLPRT